MDPVILAKQVTDILLPALPFIYVGKDAVTDKVKDMLLEKGIEKLGSKSIGKAKALFDKIRSKKNESIEIALNELYKNLEDPKAQNDLQQGILRLLDENQDLASEIESIVINFNVGKINQFAMGDHNTSVSFENCTIGGNVFGSYTDNSRHPHISGNYCTYEGRKESEDLFSYIFTCILEKLAHLLISRYGKLKSMLLGLFIAICGGFVAIYPILFGNITFFSKESTDVEYGLLFPNLFFSYIAVSIGLLILLSIVVSDHTKCKQCGRGFSYKEIKRPLIEETNCSDGIRKKTIRYYKCQYCGAEEEVPYEKVIKYKDLIK